ncbi:MAG: hypothetical protein IJS47_03545 [Clostridia bacterium]|nr:hypothetical protein [Clostridia bacterium]
MKIGCPKCGSNVSFKPETQNFYCEHCGQHSDIGEFSVDLENVNDNYDECTCSSCGAKLIVGKNTTITVCVYCGSNQIITNRFTGKFLPDEIIPFKVSQEEFIRKHKKYINHRLLAPRKFKKSPNIFNIKGIYLPFYIFNYEINAKVRGRIRSTINRTFDEYFEAEYDMLLTELEDACVQFDDNIRFALEPFNFSDSKKFNPAYLSGFTSENGDNKLKDLLIKVDDRVKSKTKSRINVELGYCTGCKIENKLNNNIKYILLPVWFFNTKYNDKIYSFSVNGQTGKVVGNVPYIVWKRNLLLALTFFITCLSKIWLSELYIYIAIFVTCVVYLCIEGRYKKMNYAYEKRISKERIINKPQVCKSYYNEMTKKEYESRFGKDYKELDIQIEENNPSTEN